MKNNDVEKIILENIKKIDTRYSVSFYTKEDQVNKPRMLHLKCKYVHCDLDIAVDFLDVCYDELTNKSNGIIINNDKYPSSFYIDFVGQYLLRW